MVSSSVWVLLEVLEFQRGDNGMFSATSHAQTVLYTGAIWYPYSSREWYAFAQMPEADVKVSMIWPADSWMLVISVGSDPSSSNM